MAGRVARRPSGIDEFLTQLEDLADQSKGKVRADVAHDKITAMRFAGSELTTRRGGGDQGAWRTGRSRMHRLDPRAWDVGAQHDFGDGPRVSGPSTILFCFWWAWSGSESCHRWDKTAPSVLAAIDAALRVVGGVATYLLTDNDKTVTVEHVAGVAVRSPGDRGFRAPLRADRDHAPAGGPSLNRLIKDVRYGTTHRCNCGL